ERPNRGGAGAVAVFLVRAVPRRIRPSGNWPRTVYAALPESGEELCRGNKKRVLLQNAPQYHHRMRSQNVHCYPGAKLAAVIRADHGVFELGKQKIQPRL